MRPHALVTAALVASACANGGPSTDAVHADTSAASSPSASTHDWTRFGWNAARTSVSTDPTGIDSANVGTMKRQQVKLPGTVDASAIYLHGVSVKGATHDVLFVTTSYGNTVAVDAHTGAILWTFTPPNAGAFTGSYQVTTSTPVADPDRQYVYAAAPDGFVRKLAVADGSAAWATQITRLPGREKIASPLNVDRGRVIAVTGGYIGDEPPYQGHVAVLDAASGTLLHVWNSLCSDRTGLLDPSTCGASDAAIWGRAGAVVDPATGNLYVATGNAPWDGKTNWGDAIVELDPLATTMLGNYTPANTETLNATDQDLGSTSPVLLGGTLVAQGGKDGRIRLIDWASMAGTAPHRGGELSLVGTPSGNAIFTAQAVAHLDGAAWLFAADFGATAAYKLAGSRLEQVWKNGNAGTSPVLAGGLLFVYDPGGGLRVYQPTTGTQIAKLDAGSGHWNSPIVVDGIIALPEGGYRDHAASGVLDIYRLP
ncbi:MAG TPA: PQQ-binding-like beta-propeller repeat protein [Gemmatimonadaceae bacterium]|nr:PQQ-binding-like beta-propeller repeat protein [Gemmatimonadaceae bacterium]